MLTVKYPNSNFFQIRIKQVYLGLGVPKTKIKTDIILPYNGKIKTTNLVQPKNRQSPFVIPGPGEYEIDGTQIIGSGDGYWEIRSQGWKLCYLCGDWQKPTSKRIDKLGQLDLIFLNLSGNKKEAKKAEEGVKRLSPKGVIFGHNAGKEFLDKIDREDITPTKKIKLKQSDLSEESTDFFSLKENK